MRNQRPAGSPFCSVSFPKAAAQLWLPRRAREDGGTHKGSVMPDAPWSGACSSLSRPSKPAMSCSSVPTSRLLEKLRWAGPPSQRHALCFWAPLFGGRCHGPGGVAGAPKWTSERTGRGAGGRGHWLLLEPFHGLSSDSGSSQHV